MPAGHVVRSGYVRVDAVRQSRGGRRLALGDVEPYYRARLEHGDGQPWPGPFGRWEGDTFHLIDGHHDFAAAFLLGTEHVLVSWIEAA